MRNSTTIELNVHLYSGVKSPAPHDHRTDLWCVSVDGMEKGRGWIGRSWGIRGTKSFMHNPTWKDIALKIFLQGDNP